jgi:predicted Zn-dependent protease
VKRIAAFFLVLIAAASALYFSQRRRDPTPISANAVMEMAADAQRDLTRVPLQFTHLSDADEIAIGNQLAQQFAFQTQTSDPRQQALERYVRRVGSSVAAHAHRRLPYTFHLIPNAAMVNAFSIPGGHVYIGAGLLSLMTTEDQLAFVLSHEVEHIDHYHCAERLQVQARLRKLKLGVVGLLVQIPLSAWQAGYNKDEELEADREGIRLAVAAGYSPYGAVSLFEKFSKLHAEYVIHAKNPADELSDLALQSLEGYFRSHPEPSERIAQANSLIAEEGWQKLTAQKPFALARGPGERKN